MAPKEMGNGGLSEESPPEITTITPIGDIVLDIHDEGRSQVFSYRVSAEHLKQASPYFVRLLDPSKFGEGAQVAEKLKDLRKTYPDMGDTPSEELPRVRIADIGRISKVNTIKNLVADFLNIIHGFEISTPIPPIPNLANLAVVADRFDALPHFSAYARRKKVYSTIDTRSKGKLGSLTEERLRQKLLIGLLLDHSPWISTYSKRLIIGGSVQWKPDVEEDDELAFWWDMPHGLEGNMIPLKLGFRVQLDKGTGNLCVDFQRHSALSLGTCDFRTQNACYAPKINATIRLSLYLERPRRPLAARANCNLVLIVIFSR
jgi:hypothetical protein